MPRKTKKNPILNFVPQPITCYLRLFCRITTHPPSPPFPSYLTNPTRPLSSSIAYLCLVETKYINYVYFTYTTILYSLRTFSSTKLNFRTPADYKSFVTSHPFPPQHNNPTGRYSSLIIIKIKNNTIYLKTNYSKLCTLYVPCCNPAD